MASTSNTYQIHATNINGLGAINVANQIIVSILNHHKNSVSCLYVGKNIKINKFNYLIKSYDRILPNPISRLVEILFARMFFKNEATLVLGDVPLFNIQNQTLFVHQSNLIKPKINPNSNRQFSFKLQRFLFELNLRYVKQIVVQSDFMKSELSTSYPNFKGKIHVMTLPPIGFKNSKIKTRYIENKKPILIYPALKYPHKNHNFLKKINAELKGKEAPFEIWLTLPENDFKTFNKFPFVKNIGVVKHSEMINIYKKVDVLVNFSNTESFCLPLIEGIFLSIPILSIRQSYSEWMCEDYSYYFMPNNVSSFFESFHLLRNDLLNNVYRNNEIPQEKFIKNWEVVANNFEKILS